MEKCLIVAVADNWGIGIKNQLPWHIAEDLKYFKATTKGFPVIMGRTTYFSLPFRPLKGRKNIVLNLGGEDIPEVTVDLRLIDNLDSHRETSRDRRYILPGYSAPEEFYQPDYSTKPLPEVKDYRRTLYWNPDLKLDDSGKAEFRFYGNGKQTHLSVRAEGMASDGTLLTGKSLPEDR